MTQDKLRNLNPWAYGVKYRNVLVLPTACVCKTSSVRESLLGYLHECYVSYKSQSGLYWIGYSFRLLQVGTYCAALDMYTAFLLDGIILYW